MSELLEVHRKTMVRAYEELDAQGWIEMRPSKGTFTSKTLPEINPRRFYLKTENSNSFPASTGYSVKINNNIRTPVLPTGILPGFMMDRMFGLCLLTNWADHIKAFCRER